MMAAYPKYESYIQRHWIGNAELPSHWAVKPLKREAEIVLGKMLCPENKGGYSLKPYLKSKNVQWLSADISSVDEMWFSPYEMRIYRLKLNDLVLSEGGEVGKTCIWRSELDECYIQNSAHKVTMRPQNEPRFHLYQLYAFGKYGGFDAAVNRVSIAHLTYEKLANIEFAFPPLPEQRAIAAFLDKKCERIDEAVRIKEEQIALLKERRQILIQQAVTRGLNPDAPMKDSGIDWIGEIPAHWEVKRLKFLSEIFRGKFTHRPRNDPRLYDGEYPFFQTGDVAQAGMFLSAYRQTLNEAGLRVSTLFPKGTILITIAANIGDVTILDVAGCFPDSVVGFKPHTEVERDFLYYSMSAMKSIFMNNSITNTQANLNVERIGGISITVPPKREQTEIVDYVKKSSKKIDSAIALKQSQIATLKEYKTCLINAAVTGKIKVI